MSESPQKKQHIRTFYFPYAKARTGGEKPEYGKVVALAFPVMTDALYLQFINRLTSEVLRRAVKIETFEELEAEAKKRGKVPSAYLKERLERIYKSPPKSVEITQDDLWRAASADRSARLFRGVATDVEEPVALFDEMLETWADKPNAVLDPFAGTGNSVLAAASKSAHTWYCEIDPLYRFFGDVKFELRARTDEARARIALELRDLSENLGERLDRNLPAGDLEDSYALHFGAMPQEKEVAATDLLRRARGLADVEARKSEFSGRLIAAACAGAIARVERRPTADITSRDALMKAMQDELDALAEFAEGPGLTSVPTLVTRDARDLIDLPSLVVDAVLTSVPSFTLEPSGLGFTAWFLRLPRRVRRRKMGREEADQLKRAIERPKSPLGKAGRILRDLRQELADPLALRDFRGIIDHFMQLAAVFDAMGHHVAPRGMVLVHSRESRVRGATIPTHLIVRELLLGRGFEEVESRLVATRRSAGKDPSLDRHVAAYRRIEPQT